MEKLCLGPVGLNRWAQRYDKSLVDSKRLQCYVLHCIGSRTAVASSIRPGRASGTYMSKSTMVHRFAGLLS